MAWEWPTCQQSVTCSVRVVLELASVSVLLVVLLTQPEAPAAGPMGPTGERVGRKDGEGGSKEAPLTAPEDPADSTALGASCWGGFSAGGKKVGSSLRGLSPSSHA